jgi:Zn-dependent peptidase ImmA (M78 family)/DNA-binding XRE family transcriptional regulator
MGKRGLSTGGKPGKGWPEMPSPTPGFVGERLREARQVRGLRAVELAEMLDVTPQAVSNYETGKKSPSPAVADAIAEKLNLPSHFFTRPVSASPDDPVFYRSMSAATKSARTRAEGRLRWLEEITHYFAAVVEFPSVNLPDFDVPANLFLLAADDIEIIAAAARRHWNMSDDGPIGNMIYLLENQGVVVARDHLGAATLDSLSSASSLYERPHVMIGVEKGTAVRWRYDAAHELGHLILHRYLDPKTLSRPADFKQIEDQAHRFASAFLLPMAPFAEDLFSASMDILRALKPKWRVSIAMMIRRARDGHLISEEHYRRMFINYSRRRWNGFEPLDDKLPAEEPRLLRTAAELTLAQGGYSAADLMAGLALSPGDIESLCGLPRGYLHQADGPRIALRDTSKEAAIYQFPRKARDMNLFPPKPRISKRQIVRPLG